MVCEFPTSSLCSQPRPVILFSASWAAWFSPNTLGGDDDGATATWLHVSQGLEPIAPLVSTLDPGANPVSDTKHGK